MDKAIEMLEGQLRQAETELENFQEALRIRKITMARTQATVAAAKCFIKHCQRSGAATRDAYVLYFMARQTHEEHEERRAMLKQLVSERSEKVWLLNKAINKIRG